MILRRPQPPLDAIVETMWLMPRRAGGADAELALPTGTVELVVNLEEDRASILPGPEPRDAVTFSGPLICGVHSRPFAIEPRFRGKTLGVHFRPGGAAALLPVAQHELENVHVELDALIGSAARALRDTLERYADDDEALFAVMERFLLSRYLGTTHPAVRAALNTLTCTHGRTDVRSLVAASGYSHRRFNELFRITVGLGAKRFARVLRFQNALRILERRTVVPWDEVVHDAAFYDQAHLIHEFQRHAGMRPSDYLSQRGERLNHPRMIT